MEEAVDRLINSPLFCLYRSPTLAILICKRNQNDGVIIIKEEFIDYLTTNLSGSVQHETAQYTALQAETPTGKLQNYIEIYFKNKSVTFRINSKALSELDKRKFKIVPDSYGWSLNAEATIVEFDELMGYLPLIRNSYSYVRGDWQEAGTGEIQVSDEVLAQFKFLMNRFITQANVNLQEDSKEQRSATLGSEGFEKNQFDKVGTTDFITIEGILYHIRLFSNGSYGPKSGNGMTTFPYFDYEINPTYNANIRLRFKDFQAVAVIVVVFNNISKQSNETGIEYAIEDLDLFSQDTPNQQLRELYQRYHELKRDSKYTLDEEEDIQSSELAAQVTTNRNVILRGAPGTGKTYQAKKIAAEIIGCDSAELIDHPQFEFVQFHPSYDYTDFVEGLRPATVDGQVTFQPKDGIFKRFCRRARQEMQSNQPIFDQSWNRLISDMKEQGSLKIPRIKDGKTLEYQVNANGSISVKDEGYSKTKEGIRRVWQGEDGGSHHARKQAIVNFLMEHYELPEYEAAEAPKFVFVIDEINRGEISKIFGELFFSIDPDYRGEKGAVSTQYANLFDNQKFYVPENVYIIGTMNDIDRSVDTFDFAMRRRFTFIEITAEQSQEMLTDKLVIGQMNGLNQAIIDPEIGGLTEDYQIGASYSRGLIKDSWLLQNCGKVS